MSSHFMKGLLVAVLAAGFTGCGSDAGSGTETLYVEASAETNGTTNGTSIFVLVRNNSANGDFAQDAIVEIVGDRGSEHALPFTNLIFVQGYFKSGMVWEPGWRLRITRGADKLEAYLQAPGITTITEPTPSSVFARGAQQPLRVRWNDDAGRRAEVVEVELNQADYEQARPEDNGVREIPYTTWTEAEQEERVTVRRTNDINLTGGVTGSFFRATSTASVTFEVQ